mgnify:CR=1 FL=1
MEKHPLLSEEPVAGIHTLAELVGLANAIEQEAVARYGFLAEVMEKRGDHETAATFRSMRDLEGEHVLRVEHWASRLGQPIPPVRDFLWLLPHDIATSWDEVQNSALLTSYRALAIAVANEERAFAHYAYIAAQATDPEVARQAEMMAGEELAHAAELRVLRRVAYRRAHPGGGREAALHVESLAEFQELEQRLEAETLSTHLAIVALLERSGDAASTRLLADISERGRKALSGAAPSPADPAGLPREGNVDALLWAAVKPLERMSEIYEDLASEASSDDILAAQQAALSRAVERIALIRARIEQIERSF